MVVVPRVDLELPQADLLALHATHTVHLGVVQQRGQRERGDICKVRGCDSAVELHRALSVRWSVRTFSEAMMSEEEQSHRWAEGAEDPVGVTLRSGSAV